MLLDDDVQRVLERSHSTRWLHTPIACPCGHRAIVTQDPHGPVAAMRAVCTHTMRVPQALDAFRGSAGGHAHTRLLETCTCMVSHSCKYTGATRSTVGRWWGHTTYLVWTRTMTVKPQRHTPALGSRGERGSRVLVQRGLKVIGAQAAGTFFLKWWSQSM